MLSWRIAIRGKAHSSDEALHDTFDESNVGIADHVNSIPGKVASHANARRNAYAA